MGIKCYYCDYDSSEASRWMGHVNIDGRGICLFCLIGAIMAYKTAQTVLEDIIGIPNLMEVLMEAYGNAYIAGYLISEEENESKS